MNCQELWPWDLRTSCRFTVLCHSRALSPLSPCHCLVHLYDLQVSFNSRQIWLWFWHSKIQSEVCNCRNLWLMFKLINMIWYANLKLVSDVLWMGCGSWIFCWQIKEAFLWITTLSCYHSPFRNTCSRKAMEYEQTKAGEIVNGIMECFSAFFPLKSDPFKKESRLSKVVLWQIRCHFLGSKGSHF